MRIVRVGYRLIAATPLRGILRSRMAQRMKKRLVGMPAPLVPEVTEALTRAGVQAWVMGGWAADSVLGEQTREHLDLDVVFEANEGTEQRALEALAGLGFQLVRREPIPGWLPTRIVLSDDGGHLVDLHPASFPGGRVVAQTADGRTMSLDRSEAFTTGNVAGRAVACLSARLQLAVRRGYEIRDIDRRDVARLCAAAGLAVPPEYEQPTTEPSSKGEPATQESAPPRTGSLQRWRARALRLARGRRPESALIVPIPEAEPIVGDWRARHDPSAAGGMPAHVTVLYPFLLPTALDRSIEEAVGSVVSGIVAFRLTLRRVDRFPGVVYLAPEPRRPFVELTEALWARWPDCPPYGGAFEAVVPHLTVSQGAEPAGLEAELDKRLPIEAEATEVHLMTRDGDGRWSVQARFPLRARSASYLDAT